VFVSSLSLFWTRACVGERWESFLSYVFCYALFPFKLTRNAPTWCIKFNGAKTLFLAVQVCLLVSRTSGGLLDQFVCFGYAKELELE
jgi:hypothetical protein